MTLDLTEHTMTVNMANLPFSTISAIYPMPLRETTATHQIAAADRARLHALGPWTGGDGSAANRPLTGHPRLLLASSMPIDVLSEMAAASRLTRKNSIAQNANAAPPTLAGVLRVDGGRVPCSRTCRATPCSMCTSCMCTPRVERSAW